MRIESIDATPVTVSFTEPEIWSQGIRRGVTAIVVQIHTDAGVVGIGESVPAPSPQVTLAAIETVKPILIGRDPREVTCRWQDMLSRGGFVSHPYTGNAALAGIEIACWDILGKSLGAAVHALLGGAIRDKVAIMGFVQNTNPAQIEADAAKMAAEGYTTLYTKVGREMNADIEAVEALRRGGGPSVELRCDANEAWTPGTALRMAHAMKHLDLQYIEQPLRMRALTELAALRKKSPVPIAANQSSWLNSDILDILRADAADVIMTDPWQAGGIGNFHRACGMCEAAGLPVVFHSYAPLSIATRAAMQVLGSSTACILANQTYNHMLADDVIKEPVRIVHGHIEMTDAPGIGVDLDKDKFAEHHEAYKEQGYASAFETGDFATGKTFFIPNQ